METIVAVALHMRRLHIRFEDLCSAVDANEANERTLENIQRNTEGFYLINKCRIWEFIIVYAEWVPI